MSEVRSTDKLLIAGALSVSIGFLISLSNVQVSGMLVYIYLFTLFNFAAYTYVYTRSADGEMELPVNFLAANALMISGAFTFTNLMAYKSVLNPSDPKVAAVYALEFSLLTLVLLPEEVAGRIK
jgi:hypothetical protein